MYEDDKKSQNSVTANTNSECDRLWGFFGIPLKVALPDKFFIRSEVTHSRVLLRAELCLDLGTIVPAEGV